MRKSVTALSAALMVTAGAAAAQTYSTPYQATPSVPTTSYPSVAPVYPTVPQTAAPATSGYPYGGQPPGTVAMPPTSQPYAAAPSYPAASQPYVPPPAYPSAAAGSYGAAPPGTATMPASGMPQALTPPMPSAGYAPPSPYAPPGGVISNGVMSSEAMQQAQQTAPITGQIQPGTVTLSDTRRAARAGGVRRQTVTNGPQVDPGDQGGPAAAAVNQRDERNYDAMLRSNPGYRSARVQKECGPLQGTGSYDSCVASFGETAGGGKRTRH